MINLKVMRNRIPVTILISGLWLMTPPPGSYVVIALLLWLSRERSGNGVSLLRRKLANACGYPPAQPAPLGIITSECA